MTNKTTSFHTWLGELNDGATNNTGAIVMLEGLYETTRVQLNDPMLQFDLLLPQEGDEKLVDCVELMRKWCEGFLFGLSLGGIHTFSNLPADTAEILHDIVEISHADAATDTHEQVEGAYTELVEYLRVGVLLINEELQPLPQQPTIQ